MKYKNKQSYRDTIRNFLWDILVEKDQYAFILFGDWVRENAIVEESKVLECLENVHRDAFERIYYGGDRGGKYEREIRERFANEYTGYFTEMINME
jgi:hypothetical protein